MPLEETTPRAGAAARGKRLPLPKPTRKGRPMRARANREAEADGTGAPPEVVARLRAWRLEESRRRRVPAFRIFGDRTLLALAEERPANEASLLDVPGLGPKLVERYGQALVKLLAPSRPR